AGVKRPHVGGDRQTLDRLKKPFADPKQADLCWCWAVGQLVERLHPKARGRAHGSGAMQKLADGRRPRGIDGSAKSAWADAEVCPRLRRERSPATRPTQTTRWETAHVELRGTGAARPRS